jgi:excinuclease UvrABC nuclease subunit
MERQYLNERGLPDAPGVYFFKSKGEILYIGKATSLRDRVRSYFSKDLFKTRSMKIADMVVLADTIDYEETESVLEALILEAELIRKHKPNYNTKDKDDKSFNFVVITNDPYPKVLTMRGRDLEHYKISGEVKVKHQFGPFTQGGMLQEALKIVRRIFPYSDNKCETLSGRPCFNHQIGLCPGVCVGAISRKDYADTIRNIKLFFEGKKRQLIKKLKDEMNDCANDLNFEEAGKLKRQIFSLEHIKDSSLIREEFRRESIEYGNVENQKKGYRIEAYDIAHIQGKSMTGVMVVVEDGKTKKSDYRMFRIRHIGANDVASLKETLMRRLRHPEWPIPDLIVVDGGVAQFNAAREVLSKYGIEIEVVAVTKDTRHKPKFLLGPELKIKNREKEILLANSEAHRFTLKYHRNLRSRNMFEN